jgi:SAM-dependent methyltransferase
VAELEATGILVAGASVEALEVISPFHIDLSEIARGGLISDGQEDVRRREGHDHPSASQRQTAAALPNPLQSVKSSYDAVAAEYAERISGELEGKPFDRALLDEIAAGATGLICDLGCGPGHVAHYLHQRGAAVLGIDLSPAMIAEARRRYPTLRFETGDIRSLPHADNTFRAVVAMYSLIHLGDRELADALREVHRTLVPGGLFLASFHRGTGAVHHDELFGRPVNLDFRFFEPPQIVVAMTDSDFEIDRLLERDPYPGVEAETTRFYVLATASENP